MHNHTENKDVQIVAVEFDMNDGVASRNYHRYLLWG